MLKIIDYTASPCPVKPSVLQEARQGAQQGIRQSRQRGSGIMRTGNHRERISGAFFEVLDYVVAQLNGKKGGTC